MSSQNVSNDGNTRRGRATSKIISLAGLGGNKSGSSNSTGAGSTFPTFRFSPENDEIQEILASSVTYLPENGEVGVDQSFGTGNDEQGLAHSESLPSSPKPGETSPIKEYIRKNWTNKWDKKSLSLDLDLRGKIKTVIEDKRKSIVSHFIPEETGIIVGPSLPSTTATIPEHTGDAQLSDNRIFSYNNTTQKVTSNMTQHHPHPKSATTVHPMRDEYEEIGVDFLACLEEGGTLDELLLGDQVDMANLAWSCPSSTCIEKFEGVLSSTDTEPSPPAGNEPINPVLTTQILNFGLELLRHSLTKYFIGLLGAAILLPIGSFATSIMSFVGGILCTVILSQTISQSPPCHPSSGGDGGKTKGDEVGSSRSSSPTSRVGSKGDSKLVSPSSRTLRLSPKSQGWMLHFDDLYNPTLNTFHHADPVFLRLDSSTLYISSPKHPIPKRKLWNDPPFPPEIKFSRHLIVNLVGAEIFIAPLKLASRRVWNKKYPIGIRLPTPSTAWQVTRVPESSSNQPSSPDTSTDSGSTAAGNGSPKNSNRDKSAISQVKGDKEFCRKDLGGKVFYLFSRTCREKEDWFRRLINAAQMNVGGGTEEGPTAQDLQQDYLRYMENIIPNLENSLRERSEGDGKRKRSTSPTDSDDQSAATAALISSDKRSPSVEDFVDIETLLTIPQGPMFLNAFMGRILYDALRSPYWSLQLQNLIQRKLNYLKRPPFVEVLNVKDLDLGGSFPMIQNASSPVIDSRGLWIDLDVTYEGNFCLTLETKINLMKLRKSPTTDDESPPLITNQQAEGKEEDEMGRGDEGLVGNLYDSEADDSGESSEEEFDPDAFGKDGEDSSSEGSQPVPSSPPQSSRRGKLMKMVEKTSNFVSEMNFVKNAVGKFANTPLLLTVELRALSGTLALNLPSPPTNRVWIGFRTKPEMKLITTPKVGERQVNLSPLTDWIQKKINQQIQRVLVLPNMDDITVRLMEFKLPS